MLAYRSISVQDSHSLRIMVFLLALDVFAIIMDGRSGFLCASDAGIIVMNNLLSFNL